MEPFRIFFPLGLLAGISGVSLWPLYFSGLHKFYPGVMHARMMIEGFLAAFVLGFLGTAVTRLTGTGPLSRNELLTLLALYAGAIGTHIAERYLAADCIFLTLLLAFAAFMARRFVRRADLPPPSFVLAAFGFLNAIAGTALLIFNSNGSPRGMLLGTQLLYQGFILYMVLGAGGFLMPRFFNLPAPDYPESRSPSREWKRHAAFAAGIGGLLFFTFLADALGWPPRPIAAARALLGALFLISQIPFQRHTFSTLGASFGAALLFLILGLAFSALWPAQRVAGAHIVFIGGFTLITLTVATRVVLGHSGHARLLTTPLPFLMTTALLILTGMLLRVAGDFLPANRAGLLSAASYLWMCAAVFWGWRVLPKVRTADSEA